MSKSILVMDTPDNCRKCKLRYDSYGQCEVCILADDVVEHFYETDTKPDWYPLLSLPEKTIVLDINNVYEPKYTVGWNNCLDYLLNSNEEKHE